MTRARACIVLAGLAAFAAPFAACFPDYTFGAPADASVAVDGTAPSDGPAGDDAAAADGSADADGGASEASSDAPDTSAPACTPSALDGSVAVGAVVSTSLTTGSGLGQPVHLVTAAGDCASWYFYPSDDGTEILSRRTTDFVTWTDGDSIPLTVGALDFGENFSVASARIQGVDVVHVIADTVGGGNTSTLHIRTTIVNGHLTTPSTVAIPGTTNGSPCQQDAPAILIGHDGFVYDATGWTGHQNTSCDLNIYRSNAVDDGATFTAAFTLIGAYYSIPTYTFAHQLVELPEAGAVIGAMPDQDNQSVTNYEALAIAISPFDPNDVPSPTELFFVSGGPQAGFADWSLCRVSDTDVRAIRHVFAPDAGTENAFQSKKYNGSAWTQDTAPGPSTSAINSGLAAVGDRDPSHAIVVATIGADGQSIDLQRWTSAGGWHALPHLARGTTVQSIAGSGCGSTHPSVFWTEGTAAPYSIVAADLSSAVAQ